MSYIYELQDSGELTKDGYRLHYHVRDAADASFLYVGSAKSVIVCGPMVEYVPKMGGLPSAVPGPYVATTTVGIVNWLVRGLVQ